MQGSIIFQSLRVIVSRLSFVSHFLKAAFGRRQQSWSVISQLKNTNDHKWDATPPNRSRTLLDRQNSWDSAARPSCDQEMLVQFVQTSVSNGQ